MFYVKWITCISCKGVRILFYVSHLHKTGSVGRSEKKKKKLKIKKCILMYNQGNMRLLVDLFIKYV